MENLVMNLCFGPLTLVVSSVIFLYTKERLKIKNLSQSKKLLFSSYSFYAYKIIIGSILITGIQILMMMFLNQEITRLISFILLVGMVMYQVIQADKKLRIKMINEL